MVAAFLISFFFLILGIYAPGRLDMHFFSGLPYVWKLQHKAIIIIITHIPADRILIHHHPCRHINLARTHLCWMAIMGHGYRVSHDTYHCRWIIEADIETSQSDHLIQKQPGYQQHKIAQAHTHTLHYCHFTFPYPVYLLYSLSCSSSIVYDMHTLFWANESVICTASHSLFGVAWLRQDIIVPARC